MSMNVYYNCGICGLFEDTGFWSYIKENYDDAEAIFEEVVDMATRCNKDKRCLARRLRMLQEIYNSEGKTAKQLETHRRLRQVLDQHPFEIEKELEEIVQSMKN